MAEDLREIVHASVDQSAQGEALEEDVDGHLKTGCLTETISTIKHAFSDSSSGKRERIALVCSTLDIYMETIHDAIIKPDVQWAFLTALINDCEMATATTLPALRAFVMHELNLKAGAAKDLVSMDSFPSQFDTLRTTCMERLSDVIFADTTALLDQLFTAPWRSGKTPVAGSITATLNDYYTDLRSLMPATTFDTLLSEHPQRLSILYTAALLQAQATADAAFVERLQQDNETMRKFFAPFASSRKDLVKKFAPLSCFADILTKDTDSLPVAFKKLVDDFPDVTTREIEVLLAMRELDDEEKQDALEMFRATASTVTNRAELRGGYFSKVRKVWSDSIAAKKVATKKSDPIKKNDTKGKAPADEDEPAETSSHPLSRGRGKASEAAPAPPTNGAAKKDKKPSEEEERDALFGRKPSAKSSGAAGAPKSADAKDNGDQTSQGRPPPPRSKPPPKVHEGSESDWSDDHPGKAEDKEKPAKIAPKAADRASVQSGGGKISAPAVAAVSAANAAAPKRKKIFQADVKPLEVPTPAAVVDDDDAAPEDGNNNDEDEYLDDDLAYRAEVGALAQATRSLVHAGSAADVRSDSINDLSISSDSDNDRFDLLLSRRVEPKKATTRKTGSPRNGRSGRTPAVVDEDSLAPKESSKKTTSSVTKPRPVVAGSDDEEIPIKAPPTRPPLNDRKRIFGATPAATPAAAPAVAVESTREGSSSTATRTEFGRKQRSTGRDPAPEPKPEKTVVRPSEPAGEDNDGLEERAETSDRRRRKTSSRPRSSDPPRDDDENAETAPRGRPTRPTTVEDEGVKRPTKPREVKPPVEDGDDLL